MKFRGTSAVNLDNKGRLAIPARYREKLIELCDHQLVCTIDADSACLLLYPLPEWEKIENGLATLSPTVPEENRLKRLMLGNAMDIEMDKNGRLLVPAELRKYAGLEKNAKLVGMHNKFEIWSEDNHTAQQSLLLSQKIDPEQMSEKLKGFVF